MGREFKNIDVARETKLNRSTVTAFYNEDAKRDMAAINQLCITFYCSVGDLLE